MDLPEKGKAYVAEQTEHLATAIEKAYLQGYNDAVEEQAKKALPVVEDGIEYIDLGLPSGTLWALKKPLHITGIEALKLNLPTKEQIKELANFTRWQSKKDDGWSKSKFRITDINSINYDIDTYYPESNLNSGEFYMWFQGTLSSECNAPIVHFYETHTVEFDICFAGYKAYAFLVKNK